MITSDTRSERDAAEDGWGRSDDTGRPPETRYSYLIALLGRLEGAVTIDRVADAVHEWERETATADGERTWYDIHEELFHVDLPVLDRAGVVRFEPGSGLVSEPSDPSADDGTDPRREGAEPPFTAAEEG